MKYLVPAADTVSGGVNLMVSSCRPCSHLLTTLRTGNKDTVEGRNREVRDIPKSKGGNEEDEIIYRPIAGER